MNSFEAIIEEVKPTVIAVTETWIDKSYKIDIEGYAEPYRNDRNIEGGGVMILVRKELKNITVEVKRTKDEMESIWVVINNDRIKIRIGLVYLPQEKDQNLKEIYSTIKEQVQDGRKKDESVIVLGDFNCKVGEIIKGNNRKISKGGKKMLKCMEKEGLELANSLENIRLHIVTDIKAVGLDISFDLDVCCHESRTKEDWNK